MSSVGGGQAVTYWMVRVDFQVLIRPVGLVGFFPFSTEVT